MDVEGQEPYDDDDLMVYEEDEHTDEHYTEHPHAHADALEQMRRQAEEDDARNPQLAYTEEMSRTILCADPAIELVRLEPFGSREPFEQEQLSMDALEEEMRYVGANKRRCDDDEDMGKRRRG